MVSTTLLVAGSIFDTVALPAFAAHNEPLAYAISSGSPPTVMVATTLLVAGSIRRTVPICERLATQALPAPNATESGWVPTLMVATTLLVCSSMRSSALR